MKMTGSEMSKSTVDAISEIIESILNISDGAFAPNPLTPATIRHALWRRMLHSLENQADRIKNSGVCCLAKKRRKKSAWASDSDDESEWEKTPYMDGSDMCESTRTTA